MVPLPTLEPHSFTMSKAAGHVLFCHPHLKTCPILVQVKRLLYMEDLILSLETVLYKHFSPPREEEREIISPLSYPKPQNGLIGLVSVSRLNRQHAIISFSVANTSRKHLKHNNSSRERKG